MQLSECVCDRMCSGESLNQNSTCENVSSTKKTPHENLIYYDYKHIDFFFLTKQSKCEDHLLSTLLGHSGILSTYFSPPCCHSCELTKQKDFSSCTASCPDRRMAEDKWKLSCSSRRRHIYLRDSLLYNLTVVHRLFRLHHFLPSVPLLHSSNRRCRRQGVIDSHARASFPSDVRSTFTRLVIYASQVHVRRPEGKMSDDAGI